MHKLFSSQCSLHCDKVLWTFESISGESSLLSKNVTGFKAKPHHIIICHINYLHRSAHTVPPLGQMSWIAAYDRMFSHTERSQGWCYHPDNWCFRWNGRSGTEPCLNGMEDHSAAFWLGNGMGFGFKRDIATIIITSGMDCGSHCIVMDLDRGT